jgi:hypothetical protein
VNGPRSGLLAGVITDQVLALHFVGYLPEDIGQIGYFLPEKTP